MIRLFSKKEITIEYTVEKCDSCSKSRRRRHKIGDTLFAKSKAEGSCGCGGTFYIDMIYGETLVR